VHSVNWPLDAAKTAREEPKPGYHEKENLSLDQQLMHDGEVNKARFMPQSHNVVAAKTVSGEVHVFDMYRHPTRPAKGEAQAKPNLRLVGHTQEGFGLSWNPVKAGVVASGSNDGQICVWNVGSAIEPEHGNQMKPELTIDGAHQGLSVEDVCWSHFDENLLVSVGDDKALSVWDCRQPQAPCS